MDKNIFTGQETLGRERMQYYCNWVKGDIAHMRDTFILKNPR